MAVHNQNPGGPNPYQSAAAGGGAGGQARNDTLNHMHLDNNQDRTWPSPAADGPVSARVRLPASKSITNRALVLAALSDGPAPFP